MLPRMICNQYRFSGLFPGAVWPVPTGLPPLPNAGYWCCDLQSHCVALCTTQLLRVPAANTQSGKNCHSREFARFLSTQLDRIACPQVIAVIGLTLNGRLFLASCRHNSRWQKPVSSRQNITTVGSWRQQGEKLLRVAKSDRCPRPDALFLEPFHLWRRVI